MKKHRKKDPASSQVQFCYTSDELMYYLKGKMPPEKRSQIFYHLNVEKCEMCRDMYISLQGPAREKAPSGNNRSIIESLMKKKGKYRSSAVPLRLEKGQIWTTSPKPKNMNGQIVGMVVIGIPVLIISCIDKEKTLENIIRVFPVSFDTEFHLEGETLVLDKTSPLGYPILLEIFNESPMLAGNLGDYRGSLLEKDLKRILALREKFMEDEISKPDKEYLEWKRKEIDLTKYLTFPVNEGLWEEELEIVLDLTYRKAADTSGIELAEIKVHQLMETDDFFLAIVQKRDKVLLRFVSEKAEPEELQINGKSMAMSCVLPGEYEATMGYADQMPASTEITIAIDGEQFTFKPRFRKSHDS